MSAPEAAESSRTSQEAEPEPEPQRKWVALLTAPVILDDDDDDRDMMLELDDPPRPSRLLLRNRCAHDPRRRRDTDEQPSAYILAVAADRSAHVLVQFGEGGIIYLCDTDAKSRTVTRLPPVPFSLRKKSLDISPDRSIALIAHPHSPAHFVVAQLHPGRHLRRPRNRLLYYSTFTRRWADRELAQSQGRTRDPSAEHGVVAHNGRLWWLDLAYGLFCSDPLGIEPLRFLPLPDDCEMADDVAFNLGTRTLIEQRRCASASEGKLRFVEIRGLPYDVRAADDVPQADPSVKMWTLVDPESPDPWKVEYDASFAEIWEAESYTDAGLPQHKVPHVAFVDPDDHGVVYFLHGSKLFGLDVRKKQVLAYQEGYGDREPMFQRPVVNALKLSPRTSTPMEHAFPRGTYLRVRVSEYEGRNGLVQAEEDGKGVIVSARGGTPHSVWMVDYLKWDGRIWMLLQNTAYGRYLAREEGMEPTAALIVDYQHPEQAELLWEIDMKLGIGGQGFLVNRKYATWDVSSEPCIFEAILATPTPPRLPTPPPEEHVLRLIVHFRANDAGNFNKGYGDSFHFYGRSVTKLRTVVMRRQEIMLDTQSGLPQRLLWTHSGLRQPDSKDVLCVWPGSCGRLIPLITNLPRSVQPMDIVVLAKGSPAAEALRYSSLDEA